MRVLVLIISATLTVALSGTAQAFCGFYVAKADTSLFNRASQVVLVRDGDRTVLQPAPHQDMGPGAGNGGSRTHGAPHRCRL